MKRFFVLMLAVLMAVSAVACTAKPAAETAAPAKAETAAPAEAAAPAEIAAPAEAAPAATINEIVYGDYTDTPNVAAWKIRTGGDKAHWVYTIYEPLFTMSKEGEVVPYLAESLESNADAMTYTVTLRDDVFFSDGSKLDADALLWNFENFKENATTASTHFGTVDHFEKVSDKAVAIHMATWSSQIPYSLCSAAGLMYSKKAFDDNGMDWCLENPVGTGAYLLKEWQTDDYKTFEFNPNYWNKSVDPAVKKITIKIVPDVSTAKAAMLNGELDVFGGDYVFTEEMEAEGFNRVATQMWYYSDMIVFASANEGSPMNDVRVRQAICYAIDSQTIKETLNKNMSLLTNQYAVEGTPFFADSVVGYEYNPEKAKQLLAEAGYADGFTTKIYTGNDLALDRLMVAVQGYLADVGITAELEYHDVSLWSSKTIYSIEEGMVMVCHGFGTNIVNQAVSNFSKMSVQGVGMMKDSAIHPDDVDEALMNALGAKNNEEMISEFARAQKLMIDDYCLFYPVDSDSYSWLNVRNTFEDNGCFGTTTEYYNYALLTVK